MCRKKFLQKFVEIFVKHLEVIISEATFLFFLFCIGLVELVELGEFN